MNPRLILMQNIAFDYYLLNVLVLENGSLLVLQIQERPKEAISSAGTVGEKKWAELYNRTRHVTSNIQENTTKKPKSEARKKSLYIHC